MPSSTSNSNEPQMIRRRTCPADRLPGGPHGRMWLAAAAMLVLALGAAELGWRALGYQPSVTSDQALWAQQRARVERAAPNSVAVLGRSRILQQFVPESFHAELPGVPYMQLAVGGKHPVAALFDIAANTEYRGVVLCSLTASSLLPELWRQQQDYVDYHQTQWGPVRWLTRSLRSMLESRLVLFAPDVKLQRIGPDLLRGEPPAQFLVTTPDRCQAVNYNKVDLAMFQKNRLAELEDNLSRYIGFEGYRDWPAGVQRVQDAVRRIERRGGAVVFLRCPTSGAYRELEEEHFPREHYWDVFTQITSAPAWHYQDDETLRDMVCAEGSHLYREDAKTFTRVIAARLRAEGLLKPADQEQNR